jgi:predicted nucleic acid-binding protein
VIVVDMNVIAYLLLPCDLSARADEIYTKDPDWAVPILWRSEFRNVLADYLRREALTFDDVVKVQGEAEALVAGFEYEVNSRRVLELVRDSGCTAYDCEFVALAMQLDVMLVTMDKKVLKAFPKRAASLHAQ